MKKNSYLTVAVFCAFICTGFIRANAQEGEYFKASYISSEGTGWWKELDMNGFSLTAGTRSSNDDIFFDVGMEFSWQGADVSLTTPSLGGTTYTYTADLAALSFTIPMAAGFTIGENVSLYAGPDIGVSLWTSDETVTRNSDGATVTAFGADTTWHWGYGVGSTIKFSDNFGIDFGWKHIEHSDFELFPGYENEYWHAGLYLEF